MRSALGTAMATSASPSGKTFLHRTILSILNAMGDCDEVYEQVVERAFIGCITLIVEEKSTLKRAIRSRS